MKKTETQTMLEKKKEDKKESKIHPKNKLNNLTNKEWMVSTKSVFFSRPSPRGKLKIQHPATFAEEDIGKLIKFFTKKGEHVFDPFVGVGSSLIAALQLSRRATGVELTRRWVELGRKRIKQRSNLKINENIQNIHEKELNFIESDVYDFLKKFNREEFDFIITSPPYWNILKNGSHKTKRERLDRKYSTKYSGDKKDLGNVESYELFIEKLVEIFDKCKKLLKKRKYMCIIVSDFKHRSKFYMFHGDLARALEEKGWELYGNIILVQDNKRLYPYGVPYAYVPNIIHQNILVFRNT